MHSNKNEQLMKISMAELKFTNISKLLLLPDNYNIKNHENAVNQILSRNYIFREFFSLESKIQPILSNLEKNGLVISGEWFKSGMSEEKAKKKEVISKINSHVHSSAEIINEQQIEQFWEKNNLPIATTFAELSRYKNLHPTYRLMLVYQKKSAYIKQFGTSLEAMGKKLDNGDVIITGSWSSFVSNSGRIMSRRLPLTSLPKKMTDYIVVPDQTQLVSIDLNNAELRFLAYYAKCTSMLEKFNNGVDVHSDTVALIQAKMGSRKEFTQEIARDLAKTYVYSYLYGASRKTIANNLKKMYQDMTIADVVILNEAFAEKYPEIQNFLTEREEDENLLTAFGSIKPLQTFKKLQRRNFTLQSSVSVAVKLLMIILYKFEIKIVHVVHDEVWIELPQQADVDKILQKIIKEFERELTEVFNGFPTEGLIVKKTMGNIIGGNK